MIDSTWNRLSMMLKQGNGNLNNEERLNLLLNSGCDVLKMRLGIVTRVDGKCVKILFSTDKRWLNAEFSLYQTLCQFTIEHGNLIASHDLTDTDWDEYGVIAPLQFGSYIGIPIIVDEQLYGTLFFASENPRKESFTRREEGFIQMVSTSVRNIIHQELIKL